MKKTGMVFGGLGLQTGLAAILLYVANLAIWASLTAMLGGAMALIGMGLVIWALYPIRDRGDDGEVIPAHAEAA